ncbi:MAG TPA: nucleoid-associated protein, partial [Longilinea sp.]|nr:nucleoid-associated protein [Longilinea sp.]
MRDISGINLINVIVHIFTPRVEGRKNPEEGWIISDRPMDLTSNQPARDFIIVHIENVRTDLNLRAAKFADLAPERPGAITAALIKKPEELIPLSQKLAKILFGILEHDRRTSVCDLAVCLFTAENYPDKYFLALLKLDPSSVFHNKVVNIDGKQVVELEMENLAFTTNRVQKAALIQGIDEDNILDLLLLDTQVRSDRGPDVALYFRQIFLGCEFVSDSTQLTGDLYDGTVEAENQLLKQGYVATAVDFAARVRSVFKMKDFRLGMWLASLPYTPKEVDVIAQAIRQKLHRENLEIDHLRVLAFPNKIRFRGSHGLIIEID